MRVRVPHNFEPRAYQARVMAFFDGGGKRALTFWHRRAGKDLAALHQTCKAAHQRQGTYWHIFPTAAQGRKAIWEGFTKDGERTLEQVFPASLRASPKFFAPKAEMVVELKCGSVWRLLGSDKMEVVGAGPVGVVFSEYALAKPKTWNLIRPMLRENDGWAWLQSTPRGKNHAYKLYESVKGDARWHTDVQTLFDTHAFNPEDTLAEERASGMPEELIAQEYLCDFSAALVGSFYGSLLAELENRGGLEAFESDKNDVFTSWDLGKTDDTAIWWWRAKPDGVDLLDHYAAHGEELGHYFHVLDERAQTHGWKYRGHFLPHDARAKTLATRLSVQEQFNERFGNASVHVVPQLSVKDGIAAFRWVLMQPGTRLHPRCSETATAKDCDGVEALKAYRREWDEDKKCFRENPVHDWTSHTADAARMLAVTVKHVQGLLNRERPPAAPRPKPLPPPIRPTLDQLWEDFERTQSQHREHL